MRVRKTFFQMLYEEREQWRKENYLLTFEVVNKNTINVMYNSGTFLGQLYIEVDGFWVFEPSPKVNCWSGQVLKMLYEKLQELNKEWEVELTAALQSKTDATSSKSG